MRVLPALRWLLIDHDVATGATISGVILVYLAASRMLRPEPVTANGGSRWTARNAAIGVFCIVLLSRLVYSKLMFDSWYLQDDAFDTCIKPLQMGTGLPIWGNDTGFLMYPLYWVLGELAGPEIQTTNAFTALLFSASLAVAVFLVVRCHGLAAGLVFGALITLSYPFVVHSVYSSAITWGAPAALIGSAWFLTRREITRGVAAGLAIVTILSLYMYPGATVSLLALAAAHRLILGARWRTGAEPVFAGVLVVAYLATQLAISRWLVANPVVRTQFAGGHLAVDARAAAEALWVYFREPFYFTNSWDAINLGGPYFEPVLLWVLVGALFARHRPSLAATCALVIAGVLASFLGDYPGARRIMWVFPSLYLTLATYLAGVARGSCRVVVALCISLALVGLRSWTAAAVSKPLSRPNAVVVECEKWRAAAGTAIDRAVLVLFEDDKNQYRSHHYWCYLTFREHSLGRETSVRLLSKIRIDARSPKVAPPFFALLQSSDPVDLIFEVSPQATRTELVYEGPPPTSTAALRVYRVE
jgi:hypothetical protein